jgi:hypothetical protein
MEVIIHVDNQKCQLNMVDRMRLAQYVERTMETLPDVGGALSAATFAPDITPDKTKAGIVERMAGIDRRRTRDHVLSKRLNRYRDEFREYLTVDRDVAVATGQSDPSVHLLGVPLEIADRLEAAGVDDLKKIQQHKDLTAIAGITPADAKKIEQAIEDWREAHNDPTLEELGLSDELAERLQSRDLKTLTAIEQYGDPEKPLAERLADLREIDETAATEIAEAVERWRTDHGEELWRVTGRVAALTDLDYGMFVDDIKAKIEPVLAAYRKAGVEGIDATYTGLVPLVYKTQHELMNGLFDSLALAFVLIAFVMMFVLRSPSAGLVSMIPNLFPVVVIFGIMGWSKILVDVGSMMTASVALGVAVDDTIHYLTWFRRGLDKGLDRKSAAMMAYERCATAMTQTTLIAGFGLAVFAFSTFTPTQRFGLLMLTLLVAALFGDLIFLPAMLSGPFGRFFRPPHPERAKAQKEQPATEDSHAVTVPMASTPSPAPGPHASRRTHRAS